MTNSATFEGVALIQTARAMLFQSHYWEAPLWFPMSQIETHVTYDEPLETVIKVKTWLCKKRGIHEFTNYSEEDIRRISE
jgi:hypothetical protein